MSLSQKIADLKALLPQIQEPYFTRLEWTARRLEIWKRRALRKGARLAALELCEQELIRAGWTHQPGAPHWKPTVNEEMGKMHRRVFELEAQLAGQDAEECALCKQYAQENAEQAAEIAVLRHDLADERRRWPECDKHRTGEPDARRGHCAQCGVEREKSKDAEIKRLKESFMCWSNDGKNRITWEQCAEEYATALAAAKATIAERDADAHELQDILRTLTHSGTALKTSARELVVSIAALEAEKLAEKAFTDDWRKKAEELRDKLTALEAEKAALKQERDAVLAAKSEDFKAAIQANDQSMLLKTMEQRDALRERVRWLEERFAEARSHATPIRQGLALIGARMAHMPGNPATPILLRMDKLDAALAPDLSTSEEGKAEAVATHCGDCDPSFTCWGSGAKCRKPQARTLTKEEGA